MKIQNTGPRTVTIRGVGIWEPDQIREMEESEITEGLLRNEFFTEVKEAPPKSEPKPEPKAEGHAKA